MSLVTSAATYRSPARRSIFFGKLFSRLFFPRGWCRDFFRWRLGCGFRIFRRLGFGADRWSGGRFFGRLFLLAADRLHKRHPQSGEALLEQAFLFLIQVAARFDGEHFEL